MNKQEKLIVAVLVLLLGGYFWWNSNQAAKREKDRPPQEKSADTGEDGAANDDDTVKEGEATDAEKTDNEPADDEKIEKTAAEDDEGESATEPELKAELFDEFKELEPAEVRTLTIKDEKGEDLAAVRINPEKGGIIAIELFNHKSKPEGDENVVMGHPDYPMLALRNAKNTLRFSHARIVEDTPTKLQIARQIKDRPIIFQQTWEIQEDSFSIDYSWKLENRSDENQALEDLRLIAGALGASDISGSFVGNRKNLGVHFRDVEGKHDFETADKVRKFDEEDREEFESRKLIWLGIQNAFFVTILEGAEPTLGSEIENVVVDKTASDEESGHAIMVGRLKISDARGLTKIQGKSSIEKSYQLYAGPKVYKRLKDQGTRQVDVMGFGRFLFFSDLAFMRWIALAIYKLLIMLQGFVGNYGVAIILITLIIRILLSPITYKSSVWSQRMKEIQPKMKALREKYADDPQKMNMMTMQLYKENKINPFAGCLPVFFQIPVFIALFTVLRSTIELRHASFLWISDLSQPDMLFMIGGFSFNLLPFTMGGAMYLQQRLMPTSADPTQQKMMSFMAIFFTFICYSMPSGLTLYWTVSNVCSIIQFRITHKLIEKRAHSDK